MSAADQLASLYLFKGVSPEALEALCSAAPAVSFEPGDVLFGQGEPATVAFIVLSGRLVARVYSREREQDVGDIRAGEIVGESALYGAGSPRNASVIAMEPTSCIPLTVGLISRASSNA
ncbi:MAG: cyclic nucleotide-binding domain-containing protein, partial [Myxococcota bacterium]|nr:cyclic nucleotide-binding domain-containing protein [Myxococcota bacterium]